MIWGYIVVAVVGWLAASAMAPKVNIRNRDDGTRTSKAATDAYIPKIYGKVGKHEGITVFKTTNDVDTDDTKNDLLHIIIVWGHAVHSIDEVYIDDIPWGDNAFLWDPEDTSPGAPRLAYVRNFTNGFNGYSDAALTAAGISATDTFDGKALSYIRLEYNPDRRVFRGEPQITADITGTLTANPAEHLQDYLTNAEYGKGLPTSFLDLAKFTDAINFCNSQVPEYEGAVDTRPLFTSNVALDTSKPVLENVNILLKAMRALMPIIDGKLSPIIEQDQPAVSFELTERVIVDVGTINNSNKNNRYNRVSVKYIEPDADWTSQEAVYTQSDWVAEDNGIILDKTIELTTCTNYYEAGAFARAVAQISREQLRVQVEAEPISTVLEVGDIVNVTHSYPGWNQKPFRVEITEQLPNGNVIFTLREHQPYLYDYYHTGDKPSIPDSSIVISPPAVPTDLAIQYFLLVLKQARFTWSSTARQFDYQLELDGKITESGRIANRLVEINGYGKGVYTFRVRAIGGSGAISGWAELGFTLEEPEPPTGILVNASNFSLEVVPELTDADESVSFEYSLGPQNGEIGTPSGVIVGPAHAYTFTGLRHDTPYPIYVRSVNVLGRSEWASAIATTANDNTDFLEFLGLDPLSEIETRFAQGWSPAREVAELFKEVFDDFERKEDIRTESKIRIQNYNELTESLATTQGTLTATVIRLDEVELESDGAVSAISAIRGEIDNPSNGLAASYTLALSASQTAAGNLEAIGVLSARVDANDDFATAQLILNAGYDNEIGALGARAFLGTDVNGRVTGIIIDDNGISQQIEFQANSFVFLDGSSNPVVFFDAANQQYIFKGQGRFTGGLAAEFNGCVFRVGIQAANGNLQNGMLLSYNTGSIELTAAGTKIIDTSYLELRSPSIRLGDASTDPSYIDITSRLRGYLGSDVRFESNVVVDADLDVTGTITNFTGSHFGLVPKNQSWKPGDIVVDVSHLFTKDISNTICINGLSNSAMQKSVVGVVQNIKSIDPASMPAVFSDYPDMAWLYLTYDLLKFNAVGEGVINVVGEGGDIEIGDYICSSSTQGKGMKQALDLKHNYSVAKARQPATFNSPGEEKQIACIYIAG